MFRASMAVWLPEENQFNSMDMQPANPVIPTISPQGTYAGYQDGESGLFYLHDSSTGAHLTTLQTGGFPLLSFSHDESFLVFQSDTEPLVPEDRNESQDVNLVDLAAALTGFPDYQLISSVPEELTSHTALNLSRHSGPRLAPSIKWTTRTDYPTMAGRPYRRPSMPKAPSRNISTERSKNHPSEFIESG